MLATKFAKRCCSYKWNMYVYVKEKGVAKDGQRERDSRNGKFIWEYYALYVFETYELQDVNNIEH